MYIKNKNFPNLSHQIFSIDTTNTDDNFLNILINYLIKITNQFIVASIYYEISKDYLCNLVYLFNLSQIPNLNLYQCHDEHDLNLLIRVWLLVLE